MVAVVIDRPLREHHVRAFRRERAAERLIVRAIDDCPPIVLPGKFCTGFENLASLLGFGGAYAGALPERCPTAIPFSMIQVEQHYLVAEFRVASDSPGAAAFRIARMAAGDHNLERRRDRL